MSFVDVGAVVMVPDVNAIDVMSVFAPLAAAPRFDLAPFDVEAFVPPFVTGNTPVTCEVKFTPVKAPPSVKLPFDVTVPDKEMPFTVPVPETLVTVPPLDGLVLVTVKFGYVPVTEIPVPLFKTTVWSGAVLVMTSVPEVVIGLPETEMPVPPEAATDVTVPEPELLGIHPLALRTWFSCPARGFGTCPCCPSELPVGGRKVSRSTTPALGATDIYSP